MKTRRTSFVLLALLVSLGGLACFSFVRGAATAIVDHARGRHVLYQLGCEIGPSSPRDPFNFRFEEILRDRYRLTFYTVGGFAPSDNTMRFVHGYNLVSCSILWWRFGRNLFDRCEAEAKSDVVKKSVRLRGCYSKYELRLSGGDRINIRPHSTADHSEIYDTRELVPIAVEGVITEVRAGAWNREHGRILDAVSIERDPAGSCANQTMLDREPEKRNAEFRTFPLFSDRDNLRGRPTLSLCRTSSQLVPRVVSHLTVSSA